MSAGLFGLLDDIAALAKLAAASVDDVGAAAGRASAKAAGVVVDDTAVTPQYVQGVAAEREIPIIKRIAAGSLRNKLLLILPVAMLLSEFADFLLPPLLMLGGGYLCFEGAEKIWEKLSGHSDSSVEEAKEHLDAEAEENVVTGAIRTDFILSAEIMVISLNEVKDEAFVSRAAILVVVAIAITILVYGVVAAIVKMDDLGLHLAQKNSAAVQRFGRGLVAAMPRLLAVISTVGVAAMLWVGGHILVDNLTKLPDAISWDGPYDLIHHLEHEVSHAASTFGGALGWLTNTVASAVVGLLVGAVVVLVMHLVPRKGGHGAAH